MAERLDGLNPSCKQMINCNIQIQRTDANGYTGGRSYGSMKFSRDGKDRPSKKYLSITGEYNRLNWALRLFR